MKKFTLYVGKMILLTLLTAIGLDVIYTTIYTSSLSKRTKVQQSMSIKSQEFDYILLGSSRVIHHIDPTVLNKTYQIKGLNLGYAAAQSNELYLMVQSLIDNNNKIDTLFIQIDDNWNSELPSQLAQVSFMPFLRNRAYRDNYLTLGFPYTLYYYLPFYRYIMNEPKIGFREVMMNLFARESRADKTLGYIGSSPSSFRGKQDVDYTLVDSPNRNFAKIDSVCHKHNIHVCYFTAPYYRPQGSNAILNNYLGDYKDFSTAYDDIKLFNDALHLNATGAEQFTKDFGAYYFGHR